MAFIDRKRCVGVGLEASIVQVAEIEKNDFSICDAERDIRRQKVLHLYLSTLSELKGRGMSRAPVATVVPLRLRLRQPFGGSEKRALRPTGDVAETDQVTLVHENALLC